MRMMRITTCELCCGLTVFHNTFIQDVKKKFFSPLPKS